MSKAGPVIGRHVVSIAAASLIAAVFNLPQPFLIVLTAFLLGSAGSLPQDRILLRIAGTWGGTISGILLITALPEQPWMLLPAFTLMIAGCMHLASRLKDDSLILVVGMACAAGVPSGILHPHLAIVAGWFHGINITCGILSAALAFYIFPISGTAPRETSSIFPFRKTLLVGIITTLGMLYTAIFMPNAGVILTIAAFIMGFRLFEPDAPTFVGQKTLGAGIGILLGIIFNMLIAGAPDNIAIFLILLSLFFAALAWLGAQRRDICPCLLQAGAMFAVAAPTIPGPVTSLVAMTLRIEQVLLGCVIGFLVYYIHIGSEAMENKSSSGKPMPPQAKLDA